MNSKSGCSVLHTSNYYFYLKNLKYPLAIIGILGGLITCMAGRILLRYIVYVGIPVGGVAISTCTLYYILDDPESSEYLFWITSIVSIFLGLMLAWITSLNKLVTTIPITGWVGFEIGLSVSNLLYYVIQNVVLFWVVIIVIMSIIVVLAASNINKHMIWVTASLGTYLVILGITVFVGRWPIDINLPSFVAAGAVIATMPYYYMYMGFWLVSSGFGVVF